MSSLLYTFRKLRPHGGSVLQYLVASSMYACVRVRDLIYISLVYVRLPLFKCILTYIVITCGDNSIGACHGTHFLALLGWNSSPRKISRAICIQVVSVIIVRIFDPNSSRSRGQKERGEDNRMLLIFGGDDQLLFARRN